MAAIGFALVDILNRSKKFSIQLSPVFLAIVAFCFSMTIGVIWEFFEYGMDQFFGLDMQKDTVIQDFLLSFWTRRRAMSLFRYRISQRYWSMEGIWDLADIWISD